MCSRTTNITVTTCITDKLQGCAYCTLFFVGLLVNAGALRALVAKWKSWTDTHVYMCNLALADFALIVFLPFRIYDAFFCLPTSTYLCTYLIYIHYVNMYVSILTTVAISVQRYLVIRFPLQARSWRKKKAVAFAVCLTIWGLVVAICVTFREENYPHNLWTCYERRKDRPLLLPFIVILVFLGFVAPLLIVMFCSSQIICILLKKEKSELKKSNIGIVTANLIVFIVCYTPSHVAFFVNYLSIAPLDWQCAYSPAHMYSLVSSWVASTNCCFDSISYYFLLKTFYS